MKGGSPVLAIVLRRFDYGESSLILHLLSREEGRLHGIAKGARRLEGEYRGGPDVLSLGVAKVYPRRPGSDLRTIGGFRTTEDFAGVRGTIPRFHAASHVGALVLAFTREEQPHPDLFDLTAAALRLLEEADDAQADAIALAFETMALRLLGFAPEVSRCVVCGKPARNVRTTRLSALRGGLLCTPCRGEDARAATLSGAAVEALRALSEGPLVAAAAHPPPEKVRREVRAALDLWTEMHLDRPLRTARRPGP